MTEFYRIQKDVPLEQSDKRTGLTDAIRSMEYLDSIVIPASQAFSAHPCASRVGIKIKTRRNSDGTVTVWRVDKPIDRNIFRECLTDEDIFG